MEVYGVKPKRFTKKWWGYFWDYYKFHTLAIVFIGFLITVSAVQCATQPRYDLNIDFVSEYGLPFEYQEKLEAMANSVIDDADKNGEILSSVLLLDLRETNDPMTLQGLFAKFAVEQASPTAYVFIASKTYAEQLMKSGILENSDVWAGEKANSQEMVSLNDPDVLGEAGITQTSGQLYVGVVELNEKNKDNETERAKYENGVRFARHLLGLE